MGATKEHFYPESRFGGFTNVDWTVAFYSRVHALIRPGHVVVDFGCGRGSHLEDPVAFRRELRSFKDKVARVIGVDVDPVGATNPYVDEFRELTPDAPWPLDTASVDVIVSDCVVEHLPDPAEFMREAKRVLNPGGYLCIRTPNVWSYVGVASRLVPNSHHTRVLSKVQTERKEEDVFPTLYRCNSVWALRRLLRANGFTAVVYGYGSEPSYLEFSKPAYWLGKLYQRFAPGVLQPAMFAFARAD